jgi:pimeloyl-ACP methyl ester carboxylesterase
MTTGGIRAAMQTRRLKAGGGRYDVDVWEAGSGAPLVYLHGEDGPRWSEYHDLLAENTRVVAPVVPDYGTSTGGDQLRDLHDLIYCGLDILDALGLREVPLVGHGLGGMLAAELAAVQPERFTHLVLIDAFGLWLADDPTLDYFAASPTDLSVALFYDQDSAAARAAAAVPTESEALIEFQLERAKAQVTAAKYLWPLPNRGLDRRLHRISAPTLVVWGERDGVMSARYGQALQSRIPGARLEIVQQAGHLPHAEQPRRVAALTHEFLAGRAAGAAVR